MESILVLVIDGGSIYGKVLALCRLAATCKRFHNFGNAATADDLMWKPLHEQCCKAACQPPARCKDAVCSAMSEWRRYAAQLALPSLEQMLNMVHRSAGAHSYYKHLNLGRSARFSFHISKVAGMRRNNGHGSTKWIDYVRGDGTEFHYTWTPTKQYRERFGQLVADDDRPNDPRRPAPERSVRLFDEADEITPLPRYILESATSLCSALVHHNHGRRDGGCYGKLHELLQASSAEAYDGVVVREGDVCDTRSCLQHRHDD